MNTRNENTGASVGANIDSKIDTLKDKVEQTKTRVIEVKDQAISRGNAMIDHAIDMIKAHPLKSVGIAFGIGYVGMRLFRR